MKRLPLTALATAITLVLSIPSVAAPQAAVNAVYYNKIQEIPAGPERDAFVAQKRDEYKEDVDLFKLAGELVIDAIVPGSALRDDLIARFARAEDREDPPVDRKHIVVPV